MSITEGPSTREILSKLLSKGMVQAELNEFFAIELREEGYSGMDLRIHEMPVQITLRVSKTEEVMGEKKKRLNFIKEVLMERFSYLRCGVEINVELIKNKGLCPKTQAEYIRQKMIENIPFRRAINNTIRNIKEGGAQGCSIIVSGKLKGQRAKSVKYGDGLIIHTGNDKNQYMREALSTVHLKQGVLGIKVRIMLPYDVNGMEGPSKEISDKIRIVEPKEIY